ncbi:MAG TPA: hypothetical protein VMT51_04225 [Dongiaceae bacterium]|nr:hypothetical protein [Dongiaceae bacterium]
MFAALAISIAPAARAQTPENPAATQKPDAPKPKTDEDLPQGPVDQNLKVIPAQAPYRIISGKERVEWALVQSFGPESLLVGMLNAGFGTARDKPEEYGPHWDGYAKRYGMRFTGVASGNTIEAGLGAIWGEDPRYVRNPNLPFKGRVRNVFVMSFVARNRQGNLMPAYARYIAIPGNNFLSNTWRVRSESTTGAALTRTLYGVLGEISSNAWSEFWPDVKRKVFHK